jgi:uncharacterized protein YndB with AHSA1/START domain
MNSAIATGWALVCLAAGIALIAASPRIGRRRAAGWLVVLGITVLTIEEAGLTLWFAVADPAGDPDGVAGLVTPVARARILDAAVFGLAVAALQCWIALTAYRRDEAWARRLLTYGLVIVTFTVTATTVFVSSRGLPLPVPAEPAKFGWQPVAVALLLWAAGLWHGRKVHDGQLTATRDIPVAPEHAYAAIMSAAGLQQWFGGVSRVDTDPGWPTPGARMRWTVRKSIRFEATVVTADPPHHVALDVRTPTATSRVAYAFAELPTGHTRYTKTVTPTYRGWARALAPVLDLVLRWSIREEVARAAHYAGTLPRDAHADHDRPPTAAR